MGFCKCTGTTSKPEIPELAKREAKLLHQVVNPFDDHEFWSNTK